MASKFANKQCFLRIVIEVRSAFLLVYLLVGDVRGMTGALLQSFTSIPRTECCALSLLTPDHSLNIQERHDYASSRPTDSRGGQAAQRVLEHCQNPGATDETVLGVFEVTSIVRVHAQDYRHLSRNLTSSWMP